MIWGDLWVVTLPVDSIRDKAQFTSVVNDLA
jgi:hypothetical protein